MAAAGGAGAQMSLVPRCYGAKAVLGLRLNGFRDGTRRLRRSFDEVGVLRRQATNRTEHFGHNITSFQFGDESTLSLRETFEELATANKYVDYR